MIKRVKFWFWMKVNCFGIRHGFYKLAAKAAMKCFESCSPTSSDSTWEIANP